MATQAARIPQSEWETRKEIIRSLYLEDDLKLNGLGGVIDVMTTHHAFSAS